MKNSTQSEFKQTLNKNKEKTFAEIKFDMFMIMGLVLSAYSFAAPTIINYLWH